MCCTACGVYLINTFCEMRLVREIYGCFRAKRGPGLVLGSQGQNLALTVLYVPCLLDSGSGYAVWGLGLHNPARGGG